MRHFAHVWISGLVGFALSGCAVCGQPGDAGRDGGRPDAGPLPDGGRIDTAGGCRNIDTGKFIIQFDSPSDRRAFCVAVSFRPWDGGFTPLFSQTASVPDPYRIDDARVGLCGRSLEGADGRLDQGAFPLEGFWGQVRPFEQQGVLLGWEADGGMVALGRQYSFGTVAGGEGLTDPCRGP